MEQNQERAIVALLTTTSIRRAASKAGIGRETLRAWLLDPGFRDSYRHARTRLVEETVGRLVGAGTRAVRELVALLKNIDPRIRLGAAKAILEHLFKGQIAELGAEVEAFLKAQAEVKRSRPG